MDICLDAFERPITESERLDRAKQVFSRIITFIIEKVKKAKELIINFIKKIFGKDKKNKPNTSEPVITSIVPGTSSKISDSDLDRLAEHALNSRMDGVLAEYGYANDVKKQIEDDLDSIKINKLWPIMSKYDIDSVLNVYDDICKLFNDSNILQKTPNELSRDASRIIKRIVPDISESTFAYDDDAREAIAKFTKTEECTMTQACKKYVLISEIKDMFFSGVFDNNVSDTVIMFVKTKDTNVETQYRAMSDNLDMYITQLTKTANSFSHNKTAKSDLYRPIYNIIDFLRYGTISLIDMLLLINSSYINLEKLLDKSIKTVADKNHSEIISKLKESIRKSNTNSPYGESTNWNILIK